MEKKSEYQISTSVNEGILEVIITGMITGNNVSKMQQEVDALRAGKGDTILLDVRAVSEGKMYSDTLYYLRQPANATGKTAILDSPGNECLQPFFERLSRGSFFKVKWFSDIDAAKRWLKSDNNKINFNFDEYL